MNHPALLTLFLALAAYAAEAPGKSESASKPNIIFRSISPASLPSVRPECGRRRCDPNRCDWS